VPQPTVDVHVRHAAVADLDSVLDELRKSIVDEAPTDATLTITWQVD
jgi:hypothetical protein